MHEPYYAIEVPLVGNRAVGNSSAGEVERVTGSSQSTNRLLGDGHTWQRATLGIRATWIDDKQQTRAQEWWQTADICTWLMANSRHIHRICAHHVSLHICECYNYSSLYAQWRLDPFPSELFFCIINCRVNIYSGASTNIYFQLQRVLWSYSWWEVVVDNASWYECKTYEIHGTWAQSTLVAVTGK